MTKIDITPGTQFKSYAFGIVYVRKVYPHAETGETCLDVKAEIGDNMHFSLAYARKLRDEGRMLP